MSVHSFLRDHGNWILEEATASVGRSRLRHYDADGAVRIRKRLEELLSLTALAVADRNLAPMVAHAQGIAQQRYEAGFDLWEVQTAFNVLEEVIWGRMLELLPPEEQGEALGLVATVLGAGKDALARTYVSLATRTRTPALDLHALFAGTEGV